MKSNQIAHSAILEKIFHLNLNCLLFHSKDNTTQTDICNNKDNMHSYENGKNWVHNLLINVSKACKFSISIHIQIFVKCNAEKLLLEIGRNSTKSIDRILDDYGAYEIMDYVVQQLSKHPFLAFGMSICILACALPFIVFMIFAIATVIMTFTGFVIIEGEFLYVFFFSLFLIYPSVLYCI